MEMIGEATVPLVIRFIALIFFVGMAENLTEFTNKILEKLFKKNKIIEDTGGFFITAAYAYLICMFGNFKFFEALDVHFLYDWMDWLMSALVTAAGSEFLVKKFNIMNQLPQVLSGIRVNRSYNKAQKKVEQEVMEDEVKRDYNNPTI